jgi:allantoin racemase
MLFACAIGRRFALVAIDPVFVPWHEEQVTRHGLDRRCVGIGAISANLPRFMRAFVDVGERQSMRADFARQVESLVARGADVVIAAGGLPMLLFAEEQPFTIAGAVVLEGIATVLKSAEMAAAIHRVTGVAASRRGLYAKAPAGAVADYLAPRPQTGSETLEDPLSDGKREVHPGRISACHPATGTVSLAATQRAGKPAG